MRIGGWIMFVLGIAMGVVLLVSSFNGNGFPLRGFVYDIFLIIAGWRLKSYGTGLVTPSPDVVPQGPFDGTGLVTSSPDAVPPGPSDAPSITWNAGDQGGRPKPAEIATVEMPFSLGVADLIKDTAKETGRQMVILMGVFAVVTVIVVVATSKSRAEYQASAHPISPLALTGFLLLGLALLVGTIWFFAIGLPVWRDLRARTYWRTRGPIQVVTMGNGLILRLADRAINVSSKSPASASLRRVDWAVVDYSKHAHVILGVWDSKGKNLFLLDGYKPEDLILVDAHIKDVAESAPKVGGSLPRRVSEQARNF